MKALEARRLVYAFFAAEARTGDFGRIFGDGIANRAWQDPRLSKTLAKACVDISRKLEGLSKGMKK
jgi:hypothetical protein